MIKNLKKYQGINVLTFFLENPTLEIHIKEVARKLKISPATAKRFCDLYSDKKIFISEKKSNSIFFKLNNFDNYVTEIKKLYAITKIRDNWQAISDENIRSVAVYGSYTSGEYSEKSDIDILILSGKKDIDILFILKFQKKIKKEVNITKITYMEWQKLKQEKDTFANEVLVNHFLIQGEKL